MPRRQCKLPHISYRRTQLQTFWTTMNLYSVHSATIYEQCPIANLEAELCNFKDSPQFLSLYLCTGCGQCPLLPDSYEEYGIIALQRSFVSTRVVEGLKVPPHTSNQPSHLCSTACHMLSGRGKMLLLYKHPLKKC